MARLLRRAARWRFGFAWYVVLQFSPLIAFTLPAAAVCGGRSLGDFARSLALLPSECLPIPFLGVILGPLWEEIGWRCVALPRLQRRLDGRSSRVGSGRCGICRHFSGAG